MLDAIKRACFIVFISFALRRSPFTLTFKLLSLLLGLYFFFLLNSAKKCSQTLIPLITAWPFLVWIHSELMKELAFTLMMYKVTLVPQLAINRNAYLYFLNKLSNFLQIKFAIKIIIQQQKQSIAVSSVNSLCSCKESRQCNICAFN